MIELQHVTKEYQNQRVVDAISFAVESGETLILLGGSGSGKTTTLRMINRLIEPTGGRILLDQIDVRDSDPDELRRRIGYVFQRSGLFPHLTVADNIGITPSLLGKEKTWIARRADELLEMVDLDPEIFRRRRPAELSGGQQQRVAVARALAASPRVMLLDEPFGALDPLTRDRLQRSFLEIKKKLALTAIFVTHDMVEALLLGDRIAVMQQGRIVQIGTPKDLLCNPANEYVNQLMSTPKKQAQLVDQLIGAS